MLIMLGAERLEARVEDLTEVYTRESRAKFVSSSMVLVRSPSAEATLFTSGMTEQPDELTVRIMGQVCISVDHSRRQSQQCNCARIEAEKKELHLAKCEILEQSSLLSLFVGGFFAAPCKGFGRENMHKH